VTGARARPVVLAAPSGTGKTTIARRLVQSGPDFCFSVSATTRARRPYERNGVDYEFLDRAAFEERVARGDFVEWAEVHGEMYGTPRAPLEQEAVRGRHVVLDIDVQGASQVGERIPDAVRIFLLPPSVDSLLSRLSARGTEDPEALARRLTTALAELEMVEAFDYVVVNDDLEAAVQRVRELVTGGEGVSPADMKNDVARLREGVGLWLQSRRTKR